VSGRERKGWCGGGMRENLEVPVARELKRLSFGAGRISSTWDISVCNAQVACKVATCLSVLACSNLGPSLLGSPCWAERAGPLVLGHKWHGRRGMLEICQWMLAGFRPRLGKNWWDQFRP
jgi:hypothetical protein